MLSDAPNAYGERDPRRDLDELDKLNGLEELLEFSRAFYADGLQKTYGPEILALSEDDEGLLAHVESDDASRQRMALCCLTCLRHVYHPRIVEKCAEYIRFGELLDVRALSIDYLCCAAIYEARPEVVDVLRDCAAAVSEGNMTRENRCVLGLLRLTIQELAPRGPRV
jgi:hypothetical protein